MRIGRLAKELDVSVSWLRQLERKGVLPPAPRDRAGHRRYDRGELEQIRQVLVPGGSPSSIPTQGEA